MSQRFFRNLGMLVIVLLLVAFSVLVPASYAQASGGERDDRPDRREIEFEDFEFEDIEDFEFLNIEDIEDIEDFKDIEDIIRLRRLLLRERLLRGVDFEDIFKEEFEFEDSRSSDDEDFEDIKDLDLEDIGDFEFEDIEDFDFFVPRRALLRERLFRLGLDARTIRRVILLERALLQRGFPRPVIDIEVEPRILRPEIDVEIVPGLRPVIEIEIPARFADRFPDD